MTATAVSPPDATARRSGPGLSARLAPSRDDAVDFGVTLLLAGLALVGLYNVFVGFEYLVVGLVGAVVAAVAAHVVAKLGVHPVVAVFVFLAVFLLAGGVALQEHAIAGLLPGPGLPKALILGVVDGWKSIVTVAPPVGLDEPLGVVPYTCGFVAGMGGMLLARKTEWPLVPVAPAFLVLAGSLVLGTRDPVSVLAQGSLFAAVAIGWGSMRGNRPRRSADGEVYWPRVVSGGAMLVGVVAVALPLAGVLPMAGSSDRYVLREEIVPPFDPRNEPSPLGAFRSFRLEEARDEALVEVTGLPAGERLRVATMDTYDGVVWVVGGPQATGSGRFERVGDKILPVPPGDTAAVEVKILADRGDVWMPTVGWTRSVAFDGARADELARTFRYNRQTGTGAVPGWLVAGDSYVLDAQVPIVADELPADLSADANLVLPDLPLVSDEVARQAVEMMGSGSDYQQARRLERFLAEECGHCYYSDGGPDSVGPAKSPAGHSLFRVETFLVREDGLIVGNAEQYAATMALLARSRGLPARVVMGFDPTEAAEGTAETEGTPEAAAAGQTRVFTADDVHAWVEIAFEDVGWVAFDPTPERNKVPEQDPPPPRQNQTELPQDLPSLEHLQLPEETSEIARDPLEPEEEADDDEAGFALPAWAGTVLRLLGIPILVIGGIWALIVGTKAMRRRRRRTRGSPVERLSGAWREVCDRARDRGASIPARVTRQEAAESIAPSEWPEADRLARDVDALMFGADDPDPAAVEGVWAEVDRLWHELMAGLGFRDRLRASLNVASLRRSR